MKTKRSPYEVLGVDKKADEATLKKAYRRRARETHPDHQGEASAPAFQAVTAAFALLMDGARRADYDATGNQETPEIPAPLGLLCVAFEAALGGYLAGKIDDMGLAIRNGLLGELNEVMGDIANCRQKLARLEKLRGKIHFSGEGENLFSRGIEEAYETGTRAILTLEQKRKDLAAAQAMAKAYRFPMDPGEMVVTLAGAMSRKNYKSRVEYRFMDEVGL